MNSATPLPHTRRLRAGEMARLAVAGLHAGRLRAALSALGITIGVASIVAVLGLSASSSAGLLAEISWLGTNLLTVTNGPDLSGSTAGLPGTAPAMIARIPGVTGVQDTGTLGGVNAYRSDLVPAAGSNGIDVKATTTSLPSAAGTSVAHGRFLNAATAAEPVAVLGAAAARRLGVDRIWPGQRIRVGGIWFYLAGILNRATLAPEIDSAVLVGYPAAERYLGFDGRPSMIYVRVATGDVAQVDNLLPAQANPQNPSEVKVSRPGDTLVAEAGEQGALNTLLLGLGVVSLTAGAIGVASTMVLAVLERRSEIGLRRALGATRGHIGLQFLSEAILLSMLGGAVGVAAGAAATAIYAHIRGWAVVIPAQAWAGGLATALLIGGAAGLLPALKAARMSPTRALWSI